MLILVSGASRGIGFEMVKHFIREPGNLVVAVSRNTEPLHKLVKHSNAHTLLPVKADITKPLQLRRVYSTIRNL